MLPLALSSMSAGTFPDGIIFVSVSGRGGRTPARPNGTSFGSAVGVGGRSGGMNGSRARWGGGAIGSAALGGWDGCDDGSDDTTH